MNQMLRDHRELPWRFLVICHLLQYASEERVAKLAGPLFARYPTANAMEASKSQEWDRLNTYLSVLGGRTFPRARNLVHFCQEWRTHQLEYFDGVLPERIYNDNVTVFTGLGTRAQRYWDGS